MSLEVRKGAIRARVMAIALQDGRSRDRIRVQMSKNGREVLATVVGKDLVRIEMD